MFPLRLHGYGLNEELLASVYDQVLNKKNILCWQLKDVPDIGFYQELHPFLKKWSITRGASKISIGRFYIAIDPSLKGRADNVYRFIERVAKSDQPSNKLMSYGFNEARAEIKAMKTEVKCYT